MVSSSKPTVLTQYPRDQKCFGVSRPLRCIYRWILVALLLFRNPITKAILYVGGTLMRIWTWLGLRLPSKISIPLCLAKSLSISPAPSSGTASGESFINSLGMEFVYISPGTFMMGSATGEKERDDDERQHRVTLTKGYYMQTTKVAQGQWQAVMGNNPSSFESCGENCPVEQVSWNDIQAFIKKLNQRDSNYQYRLPTEAEWEYAARAGSETRFRFGDSDETLKEYARSRLRPALATTSRRSNGGSKSMGSAAECPVGEGAIIGGVRGRQAPGRGKKYKERWCSCPFNTSFSPSPSKTLTSPKRNSIDCADPFRQPGVCGKRGELLKPV